MKYRKNVLILKIASSSPGGVNARSNAMVSYLSKYYNVSLRSLGGSENQGLSLAANPVDAIRRVASFIAYLRYFDVVISFSLLPNLISSLVSRNSILSLTGSSFFTLDSNFLARFYWTFILQPVSCFLASAIVPASPSVVPPYLKFFPFFRSKVHAIHGFIDTKNIDACLASASSEIVDLDFPYILFLASLSRQKGVLEIINIFALIKDIDPSSTLKLVVCGDGPMLHRCLAQCSALNLKAAFSSSSINHSLDVIFTLNLLSPYRYIANSLVVACPFFFEGLSNTILESIYLKTPVLAAHNPSTAYLQQVLLPKSSADLMSSSSLLHILPFPSKKNYIRWASALIDLTGKFLDPSRQYIENTLKFSASVNILRWKSLIDSLG